MIDSRIESMFFDDEDDLIIDKKDVAVLRSEDHLYHAMIILSTSYSSLPVLDQDDHLLGRISLSDIIHACATETTYDLNLLTDMHVKDVLEPENPRQTISRVREDVDLEKILGSLTDTNFACVVNEDNQLLGIITRKQVMGRINRIFHTLDDNYDLVEKDEIWADLLARD